MRKDEVFDETLTEDLKELMELTKDDGEPGQYYTWYEGHTDLDKMKKSFLWHYWQVVEDNQKDYLDSLLNLVKNRKKEQEEINKLAPIYEELIVNKCHELGIKIGSLDFRHPKLKEKFTDMVEETIEKRAMLCAYYRMVEKTRPKYHVPESVTGPIYDDDDNPTYYVDGVKMTESEYVKYQKSLKSFK